MSSSGQSSSDARRTLPTTAAVCKTIDQQVPILLYIRTSLGRNSIRKPASCLYITTGLSHTCWCPEKDWEHHSCCQASHTSAQASELDGSSWSSWGADRWARTSCLPVEQAKQASSYLSTTLLQSAHPAFVRLSRFRLLLHVVHSEDPGDGLSDDLHSRP